MSADQQKKQPSVVGMIGSKVLTLHFVWFVGHVAAVLHAVHYLAWQRYGESTGSYFKTLYATIVSLLVVMYKSHGMPQATRAYATRVVSDENSQYVMLAGVLVGVKTISGMLVPYGGYAVFHAGGYLAAEILPLFNGSRVEGYAKRAAVMIGEGVKAYQSKMLKGVAWLEVCVLMPWTIVAVFQGGSIVLPVYYGQFLRGRWVSSQYVKEACGEVKARVDGVFELAWMPESVKTGYVRLKETVEKMSGTKRQENAE